MGVRNLWNILAPAAKENSFSGYAAEYYETKGKPLIIGVDVSIWFNQLQYPSSSKGTRAQHGENPELRNFFYRLAFFLQLPITPLFVFDGPNRPSQKRGKTVGEKEHWLAPRCRDFIHAFGFDCHMALGEAEAELALLNKLGLIDVVMTEDSDAFIFGALTVIRGGGKTKDHLVSYSAEDISMHPTIQLDTGGLLMMPLLCGCDYNQIGLQGCANSIAHKLSHCGYGKGLMTVVEHLQDGLFPDYLTKWREEIRSELSTDSCGILGRRYHALAQSIDASFPDMDVLDKYLNPRVSPTPFSADHIVNQLGRNHIDISQLSLVVQERLGWDRDKEALERHFCELVWPGVVFRALLSHGKAVSSSDNILMPEKKQSGEMAQIYDSLGLTPLRVQNPRQSRKEKSSSVRHIIVSVDTTYLHSLIYAVKDASRPSSSSEPDSQRHHQTKYNSKVSILACAMKGSDGHATSSSLSPATHTSPLTYPARPMENIELGDDHRHPITIHSETSSQSGHLVLPHTTVSADVISISSGSLSESDSEPEIIEIIEFV